MSEVAGSHVPGSRVLALFQEEGPRPSPVMDVNRSVSSVELTPFP